MKTARASSRPRWTSAFFVSSSKVEACFFRDPALISSFSWSYFLSSSTISLNSSSEITPSMRARETLSEIVFSLLAAKTRISQCFFYFYGQAAAQNFSCSSSDSAKQSGSFEAYHHRGRDNRAQKTHTADTCQCADQEKSRITTIQNIRNGGTFFSSCARFSRSASRCSRIREIS